VNDHPKLPCVRELELPGALTLLGEVQSFADATLEVINDRILIRAASPERLDELERVLRATARRAVEVHLRTLKLEHTRSVPLPGNGGAVHTRLRDELLPRHDARCGVLHHEFKYGGSVEEGTAERATLVLPDAVIETEDFSPETNTWVRVRASSAARADELEHRVRARQNE
jgi:hypothetical protein